LGGGDGIGRILLERPGAHEGDRRGQPVAFRLGQKIRAGPGCAHIVDPKVQRGDGLELLHGRPYRQAADMIEQGGDQTAGEDACVGIADQILAPGDANAGLALMQAVEGETEGAGMGGTGRELRQDGVDETVVHANERPLSL
jgi:hypothetical protein